MNDSEKLLPESVLLQTGFVQEHASELVICKKCLGLVGFANIQNKNDVTEHFQICDCLFKGTDRKKKLIPAVEYFDFGIAFEFCYCCGLKLLSSGLNTSSFFCEECLEYVQMYNDQHILDPIPLNRNSFMIFMKGFPPVGEEQELRYLQNRMNIFIESVAWMDIWKKVVLFDNLHDMGFRFKCDLDITYYCDVAESFRLYRPEQQFRKLAGSYSSRNN